MANTVVIGMQWGDEGKGKIVDLLCPAFDAVVRYQGGNNAGHTVRFGDRHFALHFIPSGILHPGLLCVLGNGMVIHPGGFFEELEGLRAHGVETEGNLFVAERAHLILPVHVEIDMAREAARAGGKIGTTAKGIGPAYESKASRMGLRACDLAAPDLERRLELLLGHYGVELARLGGRQIDAAEALASCRDWGERLAPYLRNTSYLLNAWLDEGKSILFEGAQGTLLDLDHGTYPFVTSSNPTAGGLGTGTGVAPARIDGRLGVLKAYTTRVGSGPFVTELSGAPAEFLRERGNEYGTTTGRPRRCGWLDAVVARYSRMISGIDAVALTKLDVLDTFEEIRICVAYRVDGEERRELPSRLDELERVEPVYRTVPGWKRDTVGIVEHEDLPQAARDYISVIEEEVGAPMAVISTGPRREETILREDSPLGSLVGGRLEPVRRHRAAS